MAAINFPSALAMKVAPLPSPRTGRPVLPWEGQLDLLWLIALVATALMVWYLGQWILAVLVGSGSDGLLPPMLYSPHSSGASERVGTVGAFPAFV